MESREIHTALALFANPLAECEVPLLRGALLHAAQGDSTLFHDHVGDGLRYRYPLIQYRSHGGRAAVVCAEEGIAAMQALLTSGESLDVCIGRRRELLQMESFDCSVGRLCLSPDTFTYRILRCLPLNQANYRQYSASRSLIERCRLIERCIEGNILSMAKSMGVFFDDRVEATLLDIESVRRCRYKGVEMLAFDLKFQSNAMLPDHLGLGKGVSIGFGEVERIK